jgi:hypothetical protein
MKKEKIVAFQGREYLKSWKSRRRESGIDPTSLVIVTLVFVFDLL